MTDRHELRESGWSRPPDQTAVPPTKRKIGEGALTDGPNDQRSTPPAHDQPRVWRDPSVRLENVIGRDEPDEETAQRDNELAQGT